MPAEDTYKTLKTISAEVLFKERGSKFYARAFPVVSEEEALSCLEEVKRNHRTARHWCYAWQLGKEQKRYRANDDGEPTNSAGMPIYGQIQSFDLTDVMVVVARYFGGTKLGIGGLIAAYRTAARRALENAASVTQTIDVEFLLRFDYPEMSKVMRVIREYDLRISDQHLGLDCRIHLLVRKSDAPRIYEKFDANYKVEVTEK